MRKIFLLALLLISCITVFGQQSKPVEMADDLRASGMIYVVITIITIIFVGLAIYLFSIDRRLKKIENEK
jgi:CcmD family protein